MLGGSGHAGGGAPGVGGREVERGRERESTRQTRAPHTTSQRAFFPHEAGQIAVGAAWWLCGCTGCAFAASFLDPLYEGARESGEWRLKLSITACPP